MVKIVKTEDVIPLITDGMAVAIGGFLAVGTPELLVDQLVDSQVTGLTVIGNDTGFPDKGIGKLIVSRQVKKAIASHIGTNPETGKQMNAGELTVELVPQGTLAERLRCGGAGLGGVLTPTGLGTVVAEGKEVLTVAGQEYLLETPLRADAALIKAAVADKSGNLVCRRAAANFNPVMAMAADLVIAEVDKIVETGEIEPDHVTVPGILVDYIVLSGKGA
ncbi:CoA transferase subunit A [Sporomusa aerivorans]|uniref:CoA transferase subunit A n=1 Tax=Sporomusa aerivorans TaxID=204936 RepID=UPI00352B60F1